MIEAMKVARFAAQRNECWAQSFVRARPKREVGMSNKPTALSGSRPKASGFAGGYLLLFFLGKRSDQRRHRAMGSRDQIFF
jgi:hypothetical protein